MGERRVVTCAWQGLDLELVYARRTNRLELLDWNITEDHEPLAVTTAALDRLPLFLVSAMYSAISVDAARHRDEGET
jgi:hypothetical protein